MEVAGLAVGVLPLLVEALNRYETVFGSNTKDYGYVRGLALETTFFQARRVVERIRRHVLPQPGDDKRPETQLAGEAWSIKDSYASSLGMVAVAGAIVAQIAITALSLEYLEDTHWTAGAAFVISLVAGLLSVYFACIVQQQLSSLHSPEDTKRWLTTVRTDWRPADVEISGLQASRRTRKAYIIPSYNAALMLVLPSILLNWSSIALLIGIGVYYGLVHTKKLGTLQGGNSNLAILLVYVLFTSGALISYVIPWFSKTLESTTPVQSVLDVLFTKDNYDAKRLTGDLNSSNSVQDSRRTRPVRFGIQEPDGTILSDPDPPATMSSQPRMQADAWASTQTRRPALQSIQAHQSAAAASDSINVRSPAPTPQLASIPPFIMPSYNFANTQPIMAALQASIIAQQASLQAQEALLQKFRASEALQPSRRRASFRL